MAINNHGFSVSMVGVRDQEAKDSLAGGLPALSELGSDQLVSWAKEMGLPAFRGRQLHEALSKRGVQEFSQLVGFPSELRDRVGSMYRLRTLTVCKHLRSPTDRSEKILFRLKGGATVEAVLIPSAQQGVATRFTVCVSSQVGCPAACTFCATGMSGFTRNLTAAEITDQVMFFVGALRRQNLRVTNVVFMGMGEPLLNVSAVREAVARLTDQQGLNLGERRITISTVGIVPQLKNYAMWAGQVNLAISLHAPNDELRSQLVPYNKHFPIADLMDAVKRYISQTNRRVSFEYVLLKGVNGGPVVAAELANLLRPLGHLAHVNLIPWNPFRDGRFVRSEGPDADQFAESLRARGINATIRYSKGLDISAACGQLREIVGSGNGS